MIAVVSFEQNELYGKYNAEGSIQSKMQNGDVRFALKPTEWVVQPQDFIPPTSMSFKISNSYGVAFYNEKKATLERLSADSKMIDAEAYSLDTLNISYSSKDVQIGDIVTITCSDAKNIKQIKTPEGTYIKYNPSNIGIYLNDGSREVLLNTKNELSINYQTADIGELNFTVGYYSDKGSKTAVISKTIKVTVHDLIINKLISELPNTVANTSEFEKKLYSIYNENKALTEEKREYIKDLNKYNKLFSEYSQIKINNIKRKMYSLTKENVLSTLSAVANEYNALFLEQKTMIDKADNEYYLNIVKVKELIDYINNSSKISDIAEKAKKMYEAIPPEFYSLIYNYYKVEQELYGYEYIIRTPEDLMNLSGHTNQVCGLMADIDMSGYEWTPINEFRGTLYGGGYSIKNLTINPPDSMESNIGFIRVLSGSAINLTFENASVTVSGRCEVVGILCGKLTGKAENIVVSGSIKAEKSSYVGGIAGYVPKSGTYTLLNLTNKADISGAGYVGGIVGHINNTNGCSNETLTLKTLNNSGAITGSGDYVGGITGSLYAFADNYYSTAYSVQVYASDLTNTGDISGNTYVGGLMGYGESDNAGSYIYDSKSSAKITASAYVGCIAGKLGLIYINNCDNSGSTLNATGYVNVSGTKYAYVGGYVGSGYYALNCTNTVSIKYTGGGSYVGGIIGYAGHNGTYKLSNLTNKASISGLSYVGGIVGRINNTNGCSNETLTLKILNNSGAITGSGDYVGGITGSLYTFADNYYSTAYSVQVYASDLTNTGDISGNTYVGGLMGYGESDSNSSSLTSYFSSGTVRGNGNTSKLIGYAVRLTIK